MLDDPYEEQEVIIILKLKMNNGNVYVNTVGQIKAHLSAGAVLYSIILVFLYYFFKYIF